MRHVAIVEDDRVLNDHFARLLGDLPDIDIVQAYDREAGEKVVCSGTLDLVVLDVDLGGGTKNRYAGFRLLSDLNGQRCAAIVVSGMPEENLKGLALSLLAYDFIDKPVDDLVFVSKVERALGWNFDTDVIGHSRKDWPEELTLDPDRPPNVRWKGHPVRLTITELSIVYCLVDTPGKAVEYGRLGKTMKSTVSPSALATHITGVRKKFIDVDARFDRIDVEPGRGYVWKTTR